MRWALGLGRIQRAEVHGLAAEEGAADLGLGEARGARLEIAADAGDDLGRCRRRPAHAAAFDRGGEAGDELAALDQANAELADEVSKLNTPEGIEEAAREEIGYVQRGEIRLTVLPEPDELELCGSALDTPELMLEISESLRPESECPPPT